MQRIARARTWSEVLAIGGPVSSTVWLFFLLSPIGSLLASRLPASYQAAVLAQVAAFVTLYLVLVLRDTYSGADPEAPHMRRDAILLLLMTGLSVSNMLMAGPEWVAGFLFVSAASGSKLPEKWSLRAIVALEVLTLLMNILIGGSWVAAGQALIFVGAIGLITAGAARLIMTIRELERARGEVARLAVAEERLRLARELHDLLGHSLSLIAVKCELAKQLMSLDPPQATSELSDIERVSRRPLQDVRMAVSGYRQIALAQELAASREILSAAGIEMEIEAPGENLPPQADSILAWTVREGVTNAVRHAGPRRCSIRVERLPSKVRCTIQNDGGRSPATAAQSAPLYGNGLRGLLERVQGVGGELYTTVPPEGGFLLSVTVPLGSMRAGGVTTS